MYYHDITAIVDCMYFRLKLLFFLFMYFIIILSISVSF